MPACAPELNASEWVWKNVKHNRIAKTGVTCKQDLKAKATGALRRLQKRPALRRRRRDFRVRRDYLPGWNRSLIQ